MRLTLTIGLVLLLSTASLHAEDTVPGKAMGAAKRDVCLSNLQQIGLACRLYEDRENHWPESLDAMVKAGDIPDGKLLQCPGAKKPYVYLAPPASEPANPSTWVLACDPEGSHQAGDRALRGVLFLDGSVRMVAEDDVRKALKAQGAPAEAEPKEAPPAENVVSIAHHIAINEVRAKESMKDLINAETTYFQNHNEKTYCYDLSKLRDATYGKDGKIPLILPDLAAGKKDGYRFGTVPTYNGNSDKDPKRGFAYYAVPLEYEKTGVKTFIVNQSGVVYWKDTDGNTPPPTWPVVENPQIDGWHLLER